jgi:hypothetical protein
LIGGNLDTENNKRRRRGTHIVVDVYFVDE